jgi:CRISPR system Cascade subunit CasB
MSDYAQNFIVYLQSLKETNPGALSCLRRSLGFDPGSYTPAFPYVERFVSSGRRQNDALRRALYLAAGLFALHPLRGTLSLAAGLGSLMRERDSASVEQRFIALLGADADNLPTYLRQVVSLLRADEQPIDYVALVEDLNILLNPRADPQWRDRIRQNWARDFYRALIPPPSVDTRSESVSESTSASI